MNKCASFSNFGCGWFGYMCSGFSIFRNLMVITFTLSPRSTHWKLLSKGIEHNEIGSRKLLSEPFNCNTFLTLWDLNLLSNNNSNNSLFKNRVILNMDRQCHFSLRVVLCQFTPQFLAHNLSHMVIQPQKQTICRCKK